MLRFQPCTGIQHQGTFLHVLTDRADIVSAGGSHCRKGNMVTVRETDIFLLNHRIAIIWHDCTGHDLDAFPSRKWLSKWMTCMSMTYDFQYLVFRTVNGCGIKSKTIHRSTVEGRYIYRGYDVFSQDTVVCLGESYLFTFQNPFRQGSKYPFLCLSDG